VVAGVSQLASERLKIFLGESSLDSVGKHLLLLNNTPPPLPGVNGSKGTTIRSRKASSTPT